MTPEAAERMLETVAAQLGEHFNAVQIMVSWTDSSGTSCARRGVGDWYARQGMAHEFIQQNQAEDQAAMLARAIIDNQE